MEREYTTGAEWILGWMMDTYSAMLSPFPEWVQDWSLLLWPMLLFVTGYVLILVCGYVASCSWVEDIPNAVRNIRQRWNRHTTRCV